MTQYAALYVFPAFMAAAALSDLLTMKISNALSVLLFAAFLAMAYFTKMPLDTFGWSLGCGFFVLLITFGMFAMGWIGGGDAKLVSASAVWLGWSLLMPYLLIASIFGALLTMALLMFRRFRLPGFLAGKAWAERLHKPKGGIPYGIALAASAVCFYPSSSVFLAGAAI